MADRYDVCVPYKYQKGQEQKTGWVKVGSAWPAKSGDGFNVKLNIPVGAVEFSLFVPKAREEVGF